MTLTYELTTDEYIDAQRSHQWRKYKNSTAEFWTRFQPIAGVLLLLFGLFLLFEKHPLVWAAWTEILLGVYCILATPQTKIFLTRRFKRTRIHSGPQTLRFEEDAIYCEATHTAASRIEYSTIRSLLPAKRLIIIYLAPAVFMVIPRHLMTEERQNELIKFLEVKMGRIPKP
jgi:hypothetical protein